MDTLAGRTAVITGAASGIGLELARRFGEQGMQLVLADIEEPALVRAAAALSDSGYAVVSKVVDVREFEQIQALEVLARAHFGRVHVLCNNAGVGGGGLVASADNLEMWKWIIDIDLWGAIYGCKAFLPAMIEHDEPCHVVNTASMAGHGAMPGLGPYSVAKYGVVALSETLSMEMQMADTNVGVSVLCPAFVKTGIADSERNLPEDLKTGLAAPDEGGLRVIVNALVEGGISTEIVGDAVLQAIREDQFWILTHEQSKEHIMQRAQSIVNGETPRMSLHPQ